MNICRVLELAVKAYLEAETIADMPAIRTTDDADVTHANRTAYVLCPSAAGANGLPGNSLCTLRVELRSVLPLFSNRAAAISAHETLAETIDAALMQDDLATLLEASSDSLTVMGIQDDPERTRTNQDGTLVTALVRTIHAIPRAEE